MPPLAQPAGAELPAQVRPLRALTYLGATDNEIAELPTWIGELDALIARAVRRAFQLPPSR